MQTNSEQAAPSVPEQRSVDEKKKERKRERERERERENAACLPDCVHLLNNVFGPNCGSTDRPTKRPRPTISLAARLHLFIPSFAHSLYGRGRRAREYANNAPSTALPRPPSARRRATDRVFCHIEIMGVLEWPPSLPSPVQCKARRPSFPLALGLWCNAACEGSGQTKRKSAT